MADLGEIALVLLAAGRGSRMGGGKMALDLGGRPVALHAAQMFASLPFKIHIAVCSESTPPLSELGFQSILLQPPDAPLSHSIAMGLAPAQLCQPEAVMIALADMPFVPATHIAAMASAFNGDRLATQATSVQPPALFGAAHFPALLNLAGDRGAAPLLQGAPTISLLPELAIDIDTPKDLAEARRIYARF